MVKLLFVGGEGEEGGETGVGEEKCDEARRRVKMATASIDGDIMLDAVCFFLLLNGYTSVFFKFNYP